MFVDADVPAVDGVVDVALLRDIIHNNTGIEPDQQVVVYKGRLLRGNGSVIMAEQLPEIEVYRLPRIISVRSHFGGADVASTFNGNAPVSDLKRFLARRFLLAPYRQVLTTLEVTMVEEDPLGAYAARNPIEVTVTVQDDGEQGQLVLASVYRRDGPGSISFDMDARDTFDVLLGKMERAGMVAEGEEVTFFSGVTLFENWRTLGHYQLTHAKLWMLP